MRLKNLTKSLSIIFMLLAMMFSCQPVNDDGGSNNSGNNTTQEGGNNNQDGENGENNSDNENNGNNQGGENNGENSISYSHRLIHLFGYQSVTSLVLLFIPEEVVL